MNDDVINELTVLCNLSIITNEQLNNALLYIENHYDELEEEFESMCVSDATDMVLSLC